MEQMKHREGREGTVADGKSGGAESSQEHIQYCPDEGGFLHIILVLKLDLSGLQSLEGSSDPSVSAQVVSSDQPFQEAQPSRLHIK